ncbi:hypothetical protein ABH920_009174 [Catenulispora sp. EB89]
MPADAAVVKVIGVVVALLVLACALQGFHRDEGGPACPAGSPAASR